MSVIRRNRVSVAGLGLLLVLTSCAQPFEGVPMDYNGPIANIADSTTPRGETGADLFFLERVNNQSVTDLLAATRTHNAGLGATMGVPDSVHSVPAVSATFTIRGRTHYSMPIVEMVSRIYDISGDITFTPQASHTYTVHGVLTDSGSSVWVEDETGKVMDHKIVKADAALGILQK